MKKVIPVKVINQKEENKVKMITIKQAAKLIDGVGEYRIRILCKNGALPCINAGTKTLINKEILLKYFRGELNNKE